MAQSSENCKEMVQWTVSVPKELDDDVQTFMNTFRFGEQMDMAQLLDNALSLRYHARCVRHRAA